MVIDGVLRKASTDAVIEQGKSLYWSLAETGRLVLLGSEDVNRTDWFLRVNGFNKHVLMIPEDVTLAPTKTGRRVAQINALRRTQAAVHFVIEPDPEIARDLFNMAVPVLCYLHPTYTQPSFRPGYTSEAKPWADLVADVEYQVAQKAAHVYDHAEVVD